MHIFIIIVAFLYFISSGNKSNKNSQNSTTYNCECPYCEKLYYLEDAYYLCDCGKNFRKEDDKVYRADETVNDMIKNSLILFAYISKADDVVTENEVNVVKEFLNDLNLNKDQFKYCSEIFNTYKRLQYNKSVISLLADKEIDQSILYYSFKIIYSDGYITYKQSYIINDIVSILKIPITTYEKIKKIFENEEEYKSREDYTEEPNLSNHYKLLNIKTDASIEEIKKAYKKLIKIYHPDMQSSKNLPEEIMRDITKKCIAIQDAYDAIRKVRQF